MTKKELVLAAQLKIARDCLHHLHENFNGLDFQSSIKITLKLLDTMDSLAKTYIPEDMEITYESK